LHHSESTHFETISTFNLFDFSLHGSVDIVHTFVKIFWHWWYALLFEDIAEHFTTKTKHNTNDNGGHLRKNDEPMWPCGACCCWAKQPAILSSGLISLQSWGYR
jgi:hypothetical protein